MYDPHRVARPLRTLSNWRRRNVSCRGAALLALIGLTVLSLATAGTAWAHDQPVGTDSRAPLHDEASAAPAWDGVHPGQRAPTREADELLVPGTHHDWIVHPPYDGARTAIAVLHAMAERWRLEKGGTEIEIMEATLDGDRLHVIVSAESLAELDDHAWELLQIAMMENVSRSVGPVQHLNVRTRYRDGRSAEIVDVRPPVNEAVVARAQAPSADDKEGEARVTPRDPSGVWIPFLGVQQGQGALAGRRVAISPGHGWYWTGSSWTTQRSDSFGLIEDFLTMTISYWHIGPYLRGAGADLVWMRDADLDDAPADIVDSGDTGYSEEGSFSDGAGDGGWDGGYRFALLGDEGRRAIWEVSAAGERSVYAWWVPGGNRGAAIRYDIHHAAGTTTVYRDQRRGGPHWQSLGRYDFAEGDRIEAIAEDGAGDVLIADAMRFGTMTGAVLRNGAPLAQPGWQQASNYYAEFSGAPESVYRARDTERNSDIVARPLWSNILDVDAYLSVHTNAAGGTGTETFHHSFAPTPGSPQLAAALQSRLVGDIRAHWNADWVDRGVKSADFGEIRELSEAPGALVEIAFHDRNPQTGPDVPSLHDPRFRRIAGRAIARGMIRYLNPDALFAPEPPRAISVMHDEAGLRIDWETADSNREGADAATSWRIRVAREGEGFDEGTLVNEPPLILGGLEEGERVSVRISGINSGGEGFESNVVDARYSAEGAEVLLVNGYRRWDRSTAEEGNLGDSIMLWGDALASNDVLQSWDGATRECAPDMDEPWTLILWQAGRDGEEVGALTPSEIAWLDAYLDADASLLISGSELARDLAGDGARAPFLAESLGADPGIVDSSPAIAILDGGWTVDPLPALASESRDRQVALPEVDGLVAREGEGVARLGYVGGGAAAVRSADSKVIFMSLTPESIRSRTIRRRILRAAISDIWEPTLAPPVEPGDGAGDSGDSGDSGDAVGDAIAAPDAGGTGDLGDSGSGDSSGTEEPVADETGDGMTGGTGDAATDASEAPSRPAPPADSSTGDDVFVSGAWTCGSAPSGPYSSLYFAPLFLLLVWARRRASCTPADEGDAR